MSQPLPRSPAPVVPPPTRASRAAPRLMGVDVARGLAVIGMFAAHLWPRELLDERIFDGRSAILFATLAGVSLGLVSGGSRPTPSGRRGRVVGGIAIRAALLIVLGLTLQAWNPYLLVILPYYGVMFVLALALLFAPRAVLLGVAALLAVMAPWLASAVPVDAYGDTALSGAGGLATQALLVGAYPALVWTPFVLVGLAAARSDLTRTRTQVTLLVAGTVAAIVGYSARFVPGASSISWFDPADHEGMPAEIVGSGGVAAAVLGLLLLVTASRGATSTDREPPGGAAGVVRTVLRPLAATGAQPLTVYTAHVLITSPLFTVYRLSDPDAAYGLPLGHLVAAVVVTLAYATLWQRFVGRGPLERAVGALSRPWAWSAGTRP
ncbi:DUF418 domain-containing protein [Frigoribacterium sp. Leaf186]|uniref:DUF418 domain-containing protein n=1 Tax=Frigoribacterium sp. Leaf186 TaxID=1736293 RepID=UPI000700A45D|nr:DUF418 domain-containing protein [Frigoribacterium sp. Leaf186]KQS22521.1 hypothetical protein ASG05_02830 [Frigoribacterium sp. Leaf186]